MTGGATRPPPIAPSRTSKPYDKGFPARPSSSTLEPFLNEPLPVLLRALRRHRTPKESKGCGHSRTGTSEQINETVPSQVVEKDTDTRRSQSDRSLA